MYHTRQSYKKNPDVYEDFYGLTAKPFRLLPDSAFIFMTRQHARAMKALEYAVDNDAALSVMTGDVGAGKTTIVRHLLNRLDKTVTIGLISNTHREFGNLMQAVSLSFGVHFKGKDKVELYQDFTEFLVREYAAGRRTLLIVDEAQNLDADTLEEVRLLTNINADDHTLLQLLLVGQPELRHMLERHELRQFAQRINVMTTLGPLNEQETASYIRHRLKVAGGDPNLFQRGAVRLIYWNSRGIPRVINSLAEAALVRGCETGKRKIQPRMIADIVHERAADSLSAKVIYDLQTLKEANRANALEARARKKLKALRSAKDAKAAEPAYHPEIRQVGSKTVSRPSESSNVTDISVRKSRPGG